MLSKFWTVPGRCVTIVALALAVLSLAACGSAAEPTDVAPAPTSEPVTTAAPIAPSGDSSLVCRHRIRQPQANISAKVHLAQRGRRGCQPRFLRR